MQEKQRLVDELSQKLDDSNTKLMELHELAVDRMLHELHQLMTEQRIATSDMTEALYAQLQAKTSSYADLQQIEKMTMDGLTMALYVRTVLPTAEGDADIAEFVREHAVLVETKFNHMKGVRHGK